MLTPTGDVAQRSRLIRGFWRWETDGLGGITEWDSFALKCVQFYQCDIVALIRLGCSIIQISTNSLIIIYWAGRGRGGSLTVFRMDNMFLHFKYYLFAASNTRVFFADHDEVLVLT